MGNLYPALFVWPNAHEETSLMLTTKNGLPLTTDVIQKIRRRKHMSLSAYLVNRPTPCEAKATDPTNFLLTGNKCCFCGLPQEVHK